MSTKIMDNVEKCVVRFASTFVAHIPRSPQFTAPLRPEWWPRRVAVSWCIWAGVYVVNGSTDGRLSESEVAGPQSRYLEARLPATCGKMQPLYLHSASSPSSSSPPSQRWSVYKWIRKRPEADAPNRVEYRWSRRVVCKIRSGEYSLLLDYITSLCKRASDVGLFPSLFLLSILSPATDCPSHIPILGCWIFHFIV